MSFVRGFFQQVLRVLDNQLTRLQADDRLVYITHAVEEKSDGCRITIDVEVIPACGGINYPGA